MGPTTHCSDALGGKKVLGAGLEPCPLTKIFMLTEYLISKVTANVKKHFGLVREKTQPHLKCQLLFKSFQCLNFLWPSDMDHCLPDTSSACTMKTLHCKNTPQGAFMQRNKQGCDLDI